MKILILNGPNLNLLGRREPELYGRTTLKEIIDGLRRRFPDLVIEDFQSNSEGELIDRLQQTDADGVVLNAGGYSHTSVALADAVAAIDAPVVEVHLTNIYSREAVRRNSLLSSACRGVIAGFGPQVYALGVEALRSGL